MRIVLFFIFASVFLSCEKDTVATLDGKWDIDKTAEREYYGGNLVFSSDKDVTGETIEFRADGQVEINDQVGKRVGPYTITGNMINFLSVTYEIQNLEKHSVTLFEHHVHGAGEYHDNFMYLTR